MTKHPRVVLEGGVVLSNKGILESIEHCLSYSFENTSIVIKNSCEKPISIKALEVEYYVYIHRASSARSSESVELGHLRKRVVERISIEQPVAPKSTLSIYFGVLKNIENVFAIVEYGDKEYKVKVSREKQG